MPSARYLPGRSLPAPSQLKKLKHVVSPPSLASLVDPLKDAPLSYALTSLTPALARSALSLAHQLRTLFASLAATNRLSPPLFRTALPSSALAADSPATGLAAHRIFFSLVDLVTRVSHLLRRTSVLAASGHALALATRGLRAARTLVERREGVVVLRGARSAFEEEAARVRREAEELSSRAGKVEEEVMGLAEDLRWALDDDLTPPPELVSLATSLVRLPHRLRSISTVLSPASLSLGHHPPTEGWTRLFHLSERTRHDLRREVEELLLFATEWGLVNRRRARWEMAKLEGMVGGTAEGKTVRQGTKEQAESAVTRAVGAKAIVG
ncbi:hypothetical protein JCM5296_002467 [Sporobolomyces johnsonii]